MHDQRRVNWLKYIVLLPALWATPLLSTTVVVIRDPRFIALAADSLLISLQGGQISPVSNYCKIGTFGNIAFAASGRSLADVEKLDVLLAILTELRAGGGIDAAARRVTAKIKKPLLLVMQRQFREYPQLAQWAGSKDIGALSFVIAGFENNIAKVVIVNFEAVKNSKGMPVRLTSEIQEDPDITILGVGDAANRHIDDDAVWFGNGRIPRSPADVARGIVQLEEDDAPKLVGGPIDTLVIDPTGLHWAKPYGACQQKKTK